MRVRKPRISPRLPSDSPMITREAITAGRCILSVKKPIVPANPKPPNQPKSFWAPWGNITTPSITRRIKLDQDSSVANRTFMASLLSSCAFEAFLEPQEQLAQLARLGGRERPLEVRLHILDVGRKDLPESRVSFRCQPDEGAAPVFPGWHPLDKPLLIQPVQDAGQRALGDQRLLRQLGARHPLGIAQVRHPLERGWGAS